MSKYGVLSSVLSKAISAAVLGQTEDNKIAVGDLVSELLGSYLETHEKIDDVESLLQKVEGAMTGEIAREAKMPKTNNGSPENTADLVGFLRHALFVAKGEKKCPMCERAVNKTERSALVSDLITLLKKTEEWMESCTPRKIFGIHIHFESPFDTGNRSNFKLVVKDEKDIAPGEVVVTDDPGIFLGKDDSGFFAVSPNGRTASNKTAKAALTEMKKSPQGGGVKPS